MEKMRVDGNLSSHWDAAITETPPIPARKPYKVMLTQLEVGETRVDGENRRYIEYPELKLNMGYTERQ